MDSSLAVHGATHWTGVTERQDAEGLPLPSCLYYLAPQGIGSPLVESLSSYLTRLAQAHTVPPGALVRYIVAPRLDKAYLDAASPNTISGFLRASYHMNGVGVMAQDWVDALGALTLRSDLSSLTLRAWSEVAHERRLLISYKRWCPTCIAEWQMSQTTIYEPLLWHIAAVTVCPRHYGRLEHLCPACRRPSPWLSWWSLPGRCAWCMRLLVPADAHCEQARDAYGEQEKQADLAVRSLHGMPVSQDSWQSRPDDIEAQIHAARLIGDWLADTSQRSMPIPRDQLSDALRRVIPPPREGGAAGLARRLGVPKTTFWGWVNGRWPMALSVLVTLCQEQHCSIAAFLADPGSTARDDVAMCSTRDIHPTSPIVPVPGISVVASELRHLSAMPVTAPVMRVRLHHGRRDRQRVEQIRAAFALLLTPEYPVPPSVTAPTPNAVLIADMGRSMTLREVAAQLEVSPRTLRAYAPDLYATLLQRGRQEREERKLRRAAELAALVRQAALDVAASGAWPTCQRVGLRIGKPGIFRERGAREALAHVCADLSQPSAARPAETRSASW